MKVGDEYYYYQNDHLGTPQKMTAGNGEVVWSAKYNSFGKATIEISTIENNLRFAGQYEDAETGLHYNRFRFYDAEVGRYLRADPIGLAGGINLYAYVLNDPVNMVDPLGLIVHYEGTPEEIALIQSWMDKLKECAKCDEELRNRLNEILNGSYDFYIHFKAGWTAGGATPPRIRLDPTLKNPNYTGEYYWAETSKSDNRRIGYYRGPDVLAHELLGHGYDWSQGDFNDNQRTAIDIANKVRKCLGDAQPQRKK